jgi:hypothetical protein
MIGVFMWQSFRRSYRIRPLLMPGSTSNLCAPQRQQTKQNTVPVRSEIAHRSGLDFLAIGHLTVSLAQPLVTASLARQDFPYDAGQEAAGRLTLP